MSRLHFGWGFVARVGALAAAAFVGAALVGVFVACGKRAAPSMTPCEADDGEAGQGAGCRDTPRPALSKGDAFPAGVQTTPSGLGMLVLHPGSGTDHPALSDRVKVHYTGWKKDGTIFDSSIPRGVPGLFTLTQMIPGWTEALELMVAGEKRKLWIPAKLAYGESPKWGNPAGDLTYELELVEIIHSPKRPEDVAGPPKSAQVTPSGLAYRVLRAGGGTVHPRVTDTIIVQYSGWTTDGLLFDSSLLRNRPGSFLVGSLVKGWIEAATLMVVGERTRFWIPAYLAYGDHPTSPDAPAGMLVFDIELLEIQ
jgi:FKBP-type peptidyl-prolyl cis-trans isomerase